jgi:hypothetical protein
VDLACTDLTHEQLQELIVQALHLEPDALRRGWSILV